MKLQFIGVGGAFNTTWWQSNAVLEVNGKRLLIDAGGDVRWALKDAGLKSKDIDAVYVSHLHGDHMHGMEYMALTRYDWVNHTQPKIPLFLQHTLVKPLWQSMKAGAGTVQGRVARLKTFFDVRSVKDNGTFTWEGISFQLVQTVHYVNGFQIVPSYGLMWQTEAGVKVFFTTDTQFAPYQIKDSYEWADIIFQDCEAGTFQLPNGMFVKTGVHAHYDDLCTLPDRNKKKMWLYHYSDQSPLPEATTGGFAGFVKQGQVFDL